MHECSLQYSCPIFADGGCPQVCFKQQEYDWQIDNCNLPDRLKNDIKLIPQTEADEDLFVHLQYIRENVVKFVSGGNGFLLIGAPGTGKSVWTAKIMRAYMAEVALGSGFERRALFINFASYINELRKNVSNKSAAFTDIQKAAYKVDLLVIDDLGCTNIQSDFVHDEIYSMVNSRVEEQKSIIYTSNLNMDDLQRNLGDRLLSRIANLNEVYHIESRCDMRRPIGDFSYNRSGVKR